MAASQEKLESAMARFLDVAAEDRAALHGALQEQTKAQGTAVDKLAEVLGQQRGHTALPSVVLQKYVKGEDPDFFSNNFENGTGGLLACG